MTIQGCLSAIEQFQKIVGKNHVLTDKPDTTLYTIDWTRRFQGEPLAVLRPGSESEILDILKVCREQGIFIIPQGGNSGLVGGAVPWQTPPNTVIISTKRLAEIGPLDPIGGTLHVQAGVLLGDIHRKLDGSGWLYGVDLAARDTATIGGTVATNAGGIHVVGFGMTRENVLGLTLITSEGTVIQQTSGVVKPGGGLDVLNLACGSEGTIGIITEVVLKLVPKITATTVAIAACQTLGEAIALATSAQRSGFPLIAAEFLDQPSLDLVCLTAHLRDPFVRNFPYYVLLEIADGGEGKSLVFFPDEIEVVVGFDSSEKRVLWQYRERLSEAYSSLGIVSKLDVALPLQQLVIGAKAITEVLKAEAAVERFGIFGHLLEGNLHIEFLPSAGRGSEVESRILQVVAACGGSIASEHGVGRAKNKYLPLTYSREEMQLLAGVKETFDPMHLMNPGVKNSI